jgi:hypothetical protein
MSCYRPNYVTVWVALTDCDDTSGCMHLIPASCDPSYFKSDEDSEQNGPVDSIPFDQLQNIRSIPTLAGDLCSGRVKLFTSEANFGPVQTIAPSTFLE